MMGNLCFYVESLLKKKTTKGKSKVKELESSDEEEQKNVKIVVSKKVEV